MIFSLTLGLTNINPQAMKILRSAVFRAACAIITGILLINNPDSTVHWITIAIGVMFLVSGVISCATYLNARKNAVGAELYDAEGRLIASPRPPFPLVGIGSILLGLTLAIIPGVFVKSLMYVLGVLIILGAVNQFIALAGARRLFRVPVWFWVCPSLILVTGVFVMVKPMETASLPLLIIGWCLLFYGVTECINAVNIYRETKNELRVKSGLN